MTVKGDLGDVGATLARDSFVLLRGLLPAHAVLDVRRQVTAALAEAGWWAPGTDPMDAIPGPGFAREADGDDAYFTGYEAVQRLQAFHELAHSPALVDAAAAVLGPGEPVLVHPRKIFRASPPSDELRTPPHQDHRLIQGTVDVLTVWIPLGDCPDALGGLDVLHGSTAYGLQPIRPALAVGGVVLDRDLDELAADDRWRHAPMAAGDALLFHSLTVHAARPNRTDRVRLSVDYRYQSAREPVVEGSLRPHWWPRLPDHDELCRGWSSTASVEVPDGLAVVAPLADHLDPTMPTPPSRLVPWAG